MLLTNRLHRTCQLVRLAGRPVSALALAAACAALAAPASRAQDQGDGRVDVSDYETITLTVKDEDLSNVLELLSIETQRNIIASNNVNAKVTANLYDVTFYEALDAILNVNGFGYIEEGNFIYVYTREELAEIEKAQRKLTAKVIHLNYLNASDAAQFVLPIKSADGEIITSTEAMDFRIPEAAPVGGEDYALGAVLVVVDYEENIAAIEELVRQLDTRPSQVLVEATILQTALSEANAFGTDFSIIADIDFDDFLGGPLGAANDLISGGVTPDDNRATAITSNPGNTSGPGTFKVGVIADDVSIFVKMLDTVTDTTILSNPKILTLNRQPARVLVGRRVGYLNTTSTETATTQTVEFLDTGTQLYFRPFVANDGSIRMELKPQVSEAIIREATDVTGSLVSIPDEITQEITTNVNVADGQTIVLGGLFREATNFSRRQVPFLGDIPIVGAAFRGHEDDTDRSEIIFMITPTIVTDALVANTAERAMNDVERVRAGTRQGLLPWSREKMTASMNVKAEALAREGKYDMAMWYISRSLSLNPLQPDLLRLRERLTNEREVWPSRSIMDGIFDQEVVDSTAQVPVPAERPRDFRIDMEQPVPARESKASDYPEHDRGGRRTPHLNFSRPVGDPLPEGAAAEPMTQDTAIASDELPASRTTTPSSAYTATPSAPTDTDGNDYIYSSSEWLSDFGVDTSDMIYIEIGEAADGAPVFDTKPMTPEPTNAFDDTDSPFDETFETDTTGAVSQAGDELSSAQPASDIVAPVSGIAPRTAEQLFADELEVQDSLSVLRQGIASYRAAYKNSMPMLGLDGSFGWTTLIEEGFIATSPVNPLIDGENSMRVVVGSGPECAPTGDYGWVFDPSTGMLWAVGFDAEDRIHPDFARAAVYAAAFYGTDEMTPDTGANESGSIVGVETDSGN